MVKRSENIVHRLFDRQICNRPANTQLHRVRNFYENIVPNHTVYDVECPEYVFRKFTNDGQYLVAFSRNSLELIVYRFNWFSYCLNGDATDEQDELPPKSRRFESFFTQLYCLPLASGNEHICKDFFLTTENSTFALFATSTGPENDAPASNGAVPGVPSMEKITIFVVRLADGSIVDERIYRDDFIQLACVFMYEDLLAVLSVRYQRIHILQIRDTGILVDVRTVGEFCREDDELLLNSQAQKEAAFQSAQASSRNPRICQISTKASEPSQPSESRASQDAYTTASTTFEGNSQPPLSGVYDVHFDNYFRGLLGTNSLQANGTPETSYQQSGRAYPNSSASVNIADSERRPSYVVSSREGFLQRGESSAATSGVSQADTHAPISSTGSRHINGAAILRPVSELNSQAGFSSLRRQASLGSTVMDIGGLPSTVSGIDLLARPTAARQEDSPHDPAQRPSQEEKRPLCGIKQRLLSYIFCTLLVQDNDPSLRAQRLKRFYYLFQDYVDLVMWKVQFLDRYHLLVKFGSADGVASRAPESPQQTVFFVVYNVETTEVLEFQPNSSEEFLKLFENFADHFRVSQRFPVLMSYITSSSNNAVLREQVRKQRANAQVARRTLLSVPVKPQSQSPSAYFDHALFQFDEKLISASDRHRPCMEHPIKFISRRRPNALKFKINPGLASGVNDGRMKRVAAFIFHPIFPFAISIQQSYMQRTVVNFHYRKQ